MVLVVSHRGDLHARVVLQALRRRSVPARLLDLARFPADLAVTLRHGDGADGPLLSPRSGPPIRLREVRAVWWRRPRPPTPLLSLRDLDRFAFAWREGHEALEGLWLSLRCRWMNHPARHQEASHKPWQLALAARLGLRVPRTCVTSDPAAARSFLRRREGSGAVMKTLQATPADWRPTRLVGPGVLRRLDLLRRAPAVFQEYVPGLDVRVTAVGRRLFAATIDARNTRSPQDFRPVLDECRVEAARLPDAVARRLRDLVRALGLAYAAIDLRLSESGEWFFLEVNPAGQWLFVERRTGQPITEAVALFLATGR